MKKLRKNVTSKRGSLVAYGGMHCSNCACDNSCTSTTHNIQMRNSRSSTILAGT